MMHSTNSSPSLRDELNASIHEKG